MAINFDDVNVGEILDESEDKTDAALQNQISSLTKMTDDEIESLFPKEADAKKLVELLRIVKGGMDRNTKVNHVVDNAEKFGGVIITLLDKFV